MSSENDLFVAKIIQGDAAAVESLFKCYYSRLTLFANRFLNDIDAAEEVVSDIFLKLWEDGHEIEFTGNISSYLFKSVQNKCLNYLKHQKIENLYVNYLERQHLLNEVLTTAESPYLEKEMAQQINIALESLPGKCREIFMMSRFDHMKYKDIAKELNLSPKTVERQISIALDKLRRMLKHVSCLLF
ncbi:RNA polymerase sigma-70 factor [Mucilaginibacter sp. X4EP1]|uniref:RNA polymerase sigma-70 factor n=1 Tax=Mucilaginibacter sp. X4EP1 TaxID=2723092 RepID=UPI002167EA84|nr:RNA polymerase sigma-70 factor [Mucilaginibacter sp. X4EP1]MCS3814035.1 RNA polymerase sigma-70 factor (ECF subfamily) [Mucilaginibacter sp. X4EP1]